MDLKNYDRFVKSKLIQDISQEFGISEETAVRRTLVALTNPDFGDSIFDALKNYLNKIDHLVLSDGHIDIVNMDK